MANFVYYGKNSNDLKLIVLISFTIDTDHVFTTLSLTFTSFARLSVKPLPSVRHSAG